MLQLSRRDAIAFGTGALATAALFVTPVLLSDDVARVTSQLIYDCGIRIASGASGGSLENWTIEGHDIGICVEGANGTFNKNMITVRRVGMAFGR